MKLPNFNALNQPGC